MPNVNLIAVRRAEKKRLERNTRRLFLGLTAEVAALALVGSYLGARQIALRSSLADLNALRAAHPDVPVWCAAIDRELDERGYIRPGLGDAGDRIFGTD